MTLSRRGLLGVFASALAAPAIVKVESLMRLAPTHIIRPSSIDPSQIVNYALGDTVEITRLDVLYGKMHVRPEWALTLDDYAARVLAPMINRMQEQLAASILNGTSSGGLAGLLEATSPLE